MSKELRDSVRWSRRRRWAQRAPVEIEERLQNAASVRTEETALVEREDGGKNSRTRAGEARGTAGSLVHGRQSRQRAVAVKATADRRLEISLGYSRNRTTTSAEEGLVFGLLVSQCHV